MEECTFLQNRLGRLISRLKLYYYYRQNNFKSDFPEAVGQFERELLELYFSFFCCYKDHKKAPC